MTELLLILLAFLAPIYALLIWQVVILRQINKNLQGMHRHLDSIEKDVKAIKENTQEMLSCIQEWRKEGK